MVSLCILFHGLSQFVYIVVIYLFFAKNPNIDEKKIILSLHFVKGYLINFKNVNDLSCHLMKRGFNFC